MKIKFSQANDKKTEDEKEHPKKGKTVKKKINQTNSFNVGLGFQMVNKY